MLAHTLLIGAALAFLSQDVAAIVVPWPGSKTKVAGDLLVNACEGVPAGMSVCYPFKTNKYIECSGSGKAGKAATCSSGQVYDYFLRICLKKAVARPCPAYPCPTHYACKNASNPNIAWPQCQFVNINDTYNTMGVSELIWPPRSNAWLPGILPGPKNYTLTLGAAGSTYYFDPVIGRCAAGSWMKVTSVGPPPSGYSPKTFNVLWEGPLNNGLAYPAKIPDIAGYTGDKVFFYWTGVGDFAFTGLASFNPGAADAAPVTPYPPQPIYSCPKWIAIKDDPVVGRVVPALGGEVRLHDAFRRPKVNGSSNAMPAPFTVTVTADMIGGLIANPSPPGCRAGMVFMLKPAAARAPKVHTIIWEWTLQNLPDLDVVVGDTLSFIWHSPALSATGPVAFQLLQPNGITLLPPSYNRNTWNLRETCRTEKGLNLTIYNVTALNLTAFQTCDACLQPR